MSRAALLLFAGVLAGRGLLAAHAPSLVDAGFGAAFAALLALTLATNARSLAPPPKTALAVAAGALVSVPLSWHPLVSFAALPVVLGPMAAFWLTARQGDEGRRFARAALVVVGAVNAAAALAQRFWLWPDALARQDELELPASVISRMSDLRPIGLSLSSDLLAALCLAGAGAALSFATGRAANARVRPLAGGAAALCLAGVLASRSNGALLALACGAAAFFLLPRLDALKARPARAAGGALVVIAAAALTLALLGRGFDALAHSASERLANWATAGRAFLAHPMLGVGLGRFAPAALLFRDAGENITRYAHSWPVHWAVELGAVGIALVGAVLVQGARAVWTRASALDVTDRVLFATALALTVRCAFDYDAQVGQTATTLAVLYGLCARPRAAADAPPRAVVVGGAALVVVSLAALALAWPRANALGPFRPGGAPDDADVAALEAWGARFPSDPAAQVVRARLAYARGKRCTSDCARARAALDALLEDAVSRPHAPAAVHTVAARVALDDGAPERMLRHVEDALRVHPSFVPAHRLRVTWAARVGDARAPAFAREARIWLRSHEDDWLEAVPLPAAQPR